jgi:hypothetical protein
MLTCVEFGLTDVINEKFKVEPNSYIYTLHYGLVLNVLVFRHRTTGIILSLLLRMVKNIKESSYNLHVLLFDDLPSSQRCVFTSSFLFKSKHLCFIAIVRVEHS